MTRQFARRAYSHRLTVECEECGDEFEPHFQINRDEILCPICLERVEDRMGEGIDEEAN